MWNGKTDGIIDLIDMKPWYESFALEVKVQAINFNSLSGITRHDIKLDKEFQSLLKNKITFSNV